MYVDDHLNQITKLLWFMSNERTHLWMLASTQIHLELSTFKHILHKDLSFDECYCVCMYAGTPVGADSLCTLCLTE